MLESCRMLAAVKRLPARDGVFAKELSIRPYEVWLDESGKAKLRAVSRQPCLPNQYALYLRIRQSCWWPGDHGQKIIFEKGNNPVFKPLAI